MKKQTLFLLLIFCCSCHWFEVRDFSKPTATDITTPGVDTVPTETFSNTHVDTLLARDSVAVDNTKNMDTVLLPPAKKVATGRVQPDSVVRFAQSLIGTPYKYASANPKIGFDCSGFITYVFNHFGIAVPRSSVDFTTVGKTVSVAQARRGDLILFTGTDSTETAIGHMGLVISTDSTLQFIHSSSGKAMGVTITPLNQYYKKRFVRVARIFPQNDL